MIRLKVGWDHIAAGGSNKASGVHGSLAPILRRMIEAGWQWETVEYRLATESGGLPHLALDLPPVEQSERRQKPPASKPSKPQRTTPAEIVSTPHQIERADRAQPTDRQKRETWQDRHSQRRLSQREHQELELITSKKRLAWYDKAWESISPFLSTKVKRKDREGMCPHCQGIVTVEEVHIHPAKLELNALIRGEKEALDRIRIVLGMPKNIQAFRVKDGRGELAEHMERVNEAFKTAFQDGIQQGVITEAGAVLIWEAARRLIDGKQDQRGDV